MTDRFADSDDSSADDPSTDEHPSVDDTATTTDENPSTDGPGEVAPAADHVSRWEHWREQRRNRVSRWDRLPAPHDWRFFVGTLGKALIVTGLLMFGFVGYQLWGTGIETARAQNRLENQFELAIATNQDADVIDRVDDTADSDTADSDTTADGTTGDDLAVGDPDNPTGDDSGVDPDAPPEPRGVPSSIVPGAVDLSDEAVDQEVPTIIPGEAFARLEIPKISKQLYVVPGVSLENLKQGPGHYPDTPLPGQLGNAAIAGHRTTYGAPFFDIDQLTAGDELIVTMITGDQFVYEVTGTEVVAASDYWVVTTRDPNVAELTLTSCHPKYTARDRIVVHSVLVPERSAQVGVAEFYDLNQPDDGSIPGDDPTLESDATTDATTDPGGTIEPGVNDPADGVTDDGTANDIPADDATPDVAVTEPTAPTGSGSTGAVAGDGAVTDDTRPTGTAADEGPQEIDAFSDGWFDDSGAWLQIALWGFALTIISLLGYQVSKRTRRYTIGVLVSIAPFLFCLYFFYQNVNRLLPPGL